MLERSALIGFVAVSDVDRARQFYGETLGLPIIEESPFALVADAACGQHQEARRSRGSSTPTATTCP
jgi:catechol 2,3-dioxygenase-like lactoylglutathione lyase family enzyme